VTGFSLGEINLKLEPVTAERATPSGRDDRLPANGLQGPPVSASGGLWLLGRHRLLCGDAFDPCNYRLLLADAEADFVLCRPLLATANASNVGRARANAALPADGTREHQPLPTSSDDQLFALLMTLLARARENSSRDAVLLLFSPWQQLYHLIRASREAGHRLNDLVVWAKAGAVGEAGGDGLYDPGHELVLVCTAGGTTPADRRAPGRRRRDNVWRYAPVAGSQRRRDEDVARPLAYAPTALIADAIRTRRGDIVLDPFAGTGTALVAAEKTGRQGRALERDPLHCDLIVRRWQEYTGKAARLLGSDLTFAEAEVQRRAASSASTA
jgi:DNA methylase